MNLTPLQHQTLKILLADTNKDRPITGTNLALRIGLKGRKSGEQGGDIRSVIHALRIAGYPICATSRGYFYARTQGELSNFIVQLQGRLESQEEALKALKESFDKVGSPIIQDPAIWRYIYVKALNDSTKVLKVKVRVDEHNNPIVPPNFRLV